MAEKIKRKLTGAKYVVGMAVLSIFFGNQKERRRKQTLNNIERALWIAQARHELRQHGYDL